MTANARHPTFRHILAVIAGLIVGTLVFFYTGDSDFIIALSSGFGAVCLVYLAACLPARRSRPSARSRPF